MSNPQVRVVSKTWATRSCWFGCCNYFVIFATSQGFHLVCRMGLRAVWGFVVLFGIGFFPFSCSANPDSKGERSEQFRTKDVEQIRYCVRFSVWDWLTNLTDEILLLPTFLLSKMFLFAQAYFFIYSSIFTWDHWYLNIISERLNLIQLASSLCESHRC